MSDKATVVIDCDEGTVSVMTEEEDMLTKPRRIESSKAELVAAVLAMQSRELMAMSWEELSARHLAMLEA